MELVALDHEVLEGGISCDFKELGRRNSIARNIGLAFLEPQRGDDRLKPDLEGELVELGHAGVPVVHVALEGERLTERPVGQLEGTRPHGMLAKIEAQSSTAALCTMEGKLISMTCRKVASGRESLISTV